MKKIALLIILIVLSGCATTEWQRLSSDYIEKELGEGKYEISFVVYNWLSNLDDELPQDPSKISFFDDYKWIYFESLSDSAIYNSARVAMEKGYSYFSIVDPSFERDKNMAVVTVLCFNKRPLSRHFFEAISSVGSIKEKYGIK